MTGASGVLQSLKNFFSDESGQAVSEYVLILSVVVVGVAQLLRLMIQALDTGILRLGGQLEKDLKSGRVPLSAWKN